MNSDDFVLLECIQDGGGVNMLVLELIKRLTEGIAAMPEEVRDQAYVSLRCDGDYASASLSLGRPDTVAEREEYDRYWAERHAESRRDAEEQELIEYQRLKAKFGDRV